MMKIIWMMISILGCFLLNVSCIEENSFERNIENNDFNEKLESPSNPPVTLKIEKKQVIIDNGIIRVSILKPRGHLQGIFYHGIDNVLDGSTHDRGYWDMVWSQPKKEDKIDKLGGENYKVITQNDDQVEISFSRNWNIKNLESEVPLNFDKRYIVRRGFSGIYMYSIFERLAEWPTVKMNQLRIVYRLQPQKFDFMALSDNRQRIMPNDKDRSGNRAKTLDYDEAVLLTNPTNPALRGEVDDKYQYSSDNKDNKVHGWISDKSGVGFWTITPSNEFRMAGPLKQDLTSQAGPTTISSFTSFHYIGSDINTTYVNGEAWKKVFGPVLIYLNSDSSNNTRSNLWNDAKKQMNVEVESWPYNFIESKDFPPASQRGTVSGQLIVNDQLKRLDGKNANIGLALPGDAGSWQRECKGYQFWTETDQKGNFVIKNVRAGKYNLYAWVDGYIGDYKYEQDITITPGSQIKLGSIVYNPPRNGPTLWEIGIPNRKADEFFVPDAYPTLSNSLYTKLDKFRQYGLWQKYSDLYTRNDLVYTIGKSGYTKDWFYAHVTRNTGNGKYKGTTWQIIFKIKNVKRGKYTLQLALAAASGAQLRIDFNNLNEKHPVFKTEMIGRDNAIARHGIHGLYRLYSIDVQSNRLRNGENTLYLTQTRGGSPFTGLMYDYIRLEAPPNKA